ncbi:MAG: nucleotidyltransferase family protein, partial [Pseudomonadota bacterium]
FLVGSTSVGLRQTGPASPVQLHAPYGLDDLYQGILRGNPSVDHGDLYECKARDYQSRWPWLQLAE